MARDTKRGGALDDVPPASLWRRFLSAIRGDAPVAPQEPVDSPVELPFHVPLAPLTARGNATVALRGALLGFGIVHDPETIDRACKVTHEGSASIDDLESVARQYGLDVEQQIVPTEHLLLAPARLLPAIAVAHGKNGGFVFVLVWNCDESRVQVLDADGVCRWLDGEEFRTWLYVHEMDVPANSLTEWIRRDEFIQPVAVRLAERGVSDARELLRDALAIPGWRGVAALDAALRAHENLRGTAMSDAVRAVLRAPADVLSPDRWTVQVPDRKASREEVTLRGCVVVTICGRLPPRSHRG
jgi:ATP-binding cassette subfamily B protein